MSSKEHALESYTGFEQGPIRPPSEAASLLIRITRNCPWNKCTFCPVYKESKFSIRDVSHVIKDIDAVRFSIEKIQNLADSNNRISQTKLHKFLSSLDQNQTIAAQTAIAWISGNMESVFIQDANSLIIKPENLVEILTHIKKSFPWIKRITSYARSHTIAQISDDNMKRIYTAGLSRIHIGLESGSDKVLNMVKKGATKKIHIKAGLKVKSAGIELSEYVMPGLGGKILSEENALETADALNQINPDFIRIRSLAIPPGIKLYNDYKSGKFEKCTDLMMSEEILLFLESLKDINSRIKSDHILNLFQEIDGVLPEDKQKMIDVVKSFLNMNKKQKMIYQIGKRFNIFTSISDIENKILVQKTEDICKKFSITPDNSDKIIEDIMMKFI
jgi:histone acetyltransferase (RNA polymerase elongator complex component)